MYLPKANWGHFSCNHISITTLKKIICLVSTLKGSLQPMGSKSHMTQQLNNNEVTYTPHSSFSVVPQISFTAVPSNPFKVHALHRQFQDLLPHSSVPFTHFSLSIRALTTFKSPAQLSDTLPTHSRCQFPHDQIQIKELQQDHHTGLQGTSHCITSGCTQH